MCFHKGIVPIVFIYIKPNSGKCPNSASIMLRIWTLSACFNIELLRFFVVLRQIQHYLSYIGATLILLETPDSCPRRQNAIELRPELETFGLQTKFNITSVILRLQFTYSGFVLHTFLPSQRLLFSHWYYKRRLNPVLENKMQSSWDLNWRLLDYKLYSTLSQSRGQCTNSGLVLHIYLVLPGHIQHYLCYIAAAMHLFRFSTSHIFSTSWPYSTLSLLYRGGSAPRQCLYLTYIYLATGFFSDIDTIDTWILSSKAKCNWAEARTGYFWMTKLRSVIILCHRPWHSIRDTKFKSLHQTYQASLNPSSRH